jgi:aspartyl-tRNA(Asn)/glutamyl-tRNA(Gln) amidotransferase subunit A
LCGLVGIKPTYGRVSLEGVRLLSPSFDTPGPMARTTRDAAVMLRAMADPVTDEAIPTANRIAHLTSEMPVGLEGLRVGVPSNYFFDDLDPESERIVLAAVDALAILGGDLVQVGMPSVPDLALSQRGILTIEAYHNVLSATGGDVTRVNPTLRARLKLGLDEAMRPGEDLQVTLGRLRSERDDALAAYRRAAGTVDVLVAPVLQRPPPRIDAALTDYHWMPNLTRPFNATHQPVVAVPCGWTADGLPVGLQIVAAKYRERIALRVAYAYEQSDHAPERRWPDLLAAA